MPLPDPRRHAWPYSTSVTERMEMAQWATWLAQRLIQSLEEKSSRCSEDRRYWWCASSIGWGWARAAPHSQVIQDDFSRVSCRGVDRTRNEYGGRVRPSNQRVGEFAPAGYWGGRHARVGALQTVRTQYIFFPLLEVRLKRVQDSAKEGCRDLLRARSFNLMAPLSADS